MTHEKIIKREDGTEVKIVMMIKADIWYKPAWGEFHRIENLNYRPKLSTEEILSAKLELWEKLKPTL